MEDFLTGIIEQLFASLLLVPIGFVYLWLRFRHRIRVAQALAQEYEDSYANAGSAILANTIAALGALAVSSLIILAVVVQIREWLHG
ncbi:hypothetical protein MON38_00840 [Hymenobacter sp. DH14]|uniref:Uncharacterized protein n=1 Tax=Hymenobacter cyanobacteriorum TaxID=2926463 RepID=A0A9X2AF02_9BACT|nr:hypothetical protein [Hymenobacter cyanobacteriorum]MCI1185948.1 hypothetical protein [Hymenobacter cyanobacteriorum]